MEIERTVPLRIHKNLVIQCLRDHPEDLTKIMPDFISADEAIAALEAHSGEWFVNGELEEEKR